jgi:O-antigen ligase
MLLKTNSAVIKFIIYSAVANTLIVSPFINKDGMIIPKLMVMFSVSMFLLPLVLLNLRQMLANNVFRITAFILLVLLVQNILVIAFSAAPLEQQIFGRSGRGLGFITTISLTLVLLAVLIFIEINAIEKLLFGLIISAVITSIYAIFQSFGLDILKWDSKSNGVFGTLGNPNFQSAFAAMAIMPTLLYFRFKTRNLYVGVIFILILSYVIFRTRSIQGILAAVFSSVVVLVIYFWYKNKFLFYALFFLSFIVGLFSIFGMLKFGPLSKFLYKTSIESRGDFWRSAFSAANDNPFFGVGIDSFGDYFLKYRDSIAAGHTFKEYTDNAHNFFLEQAATGGYPSAVLNLLIVFLVLYLFVKIMSRSEIFDPRITALFAAWVAFQMVTIISPGNLSSMYWNSIISGALLGVARILFTPEDKSIERLKISASTLPSVCLGLAGLIFLTPLFNTDRLQFKGMSTRDANLVMKATTMYPESTVRYSVIGRELFDSGLNQQALEIARSGTKFNPNSAALWALILVNPSANNEERSAAKNKILQLDPLNMEVRNYAP